MTNTFATDSVIATKLRRPAVGRETVVRSRLVERLTPPADITLVIAAAGYGKTTLVSRWLETCDLPSAWVSFDEEDSDLIVFINYLAAALHTLFPGVCDETLDLLHGPTAPALDVITRSLRNALAATPREFILVLDDYQYIRDRAIHELMAELLRHPPPAMHLVLAARSNPPLPLSRFRSRGRVVELREADLRFTLEEATIFLRDGMRIVVDDHDMAVLFAQTEGWAVGLHLTAQYFRHTQDLAALRSNPNGYNPYVISYLLAEVLSRIPPEAREILVKTSILDRLSNPLCGAVIGTAEVEGGSRNWLEWLEQSGLFVVPVDHERVWFRLHPLLRRLLRQQLASELGAGEIRELHMHAARWFAGQVLVDDALRHALAAGNTDYAIQVFAQHRVEALNREDWPLIERCLRQFPRDAVERQPVLLLSEAGLQVRRTQFAEAMMTLARVEELSACSELDPSDREALLGETAAWKAKPLYYAGDFVGSTAAAQTALEKLTANLWNMRAEARLVRGNGFLANGDLANALATFYGVPDHGHGQAIPLHLYESVCFVHWLMADLDAMERAATQAINWGNEVRTHTATQAWARCHLGVVRYQRNELAMAESVLLPQMTDRNRMETLCVINSAGSLMRIYQAQGRFEEARALAETVMQAGLEVHGRRALFIAGGFHAELALRQGRLPVASLWAEQYSEPAYSPLPYVCRPPLILARVLLAQNTPASRKRAKAWLSEVLDHFTRIHYTSVQIEALAVLALLLQAEGHSQAALDTLQHSLTLAEAGGFVRLYLDLGSPLEPLLKVLARERSGWPYLRMLVTAFARATSPADGQHRANAALASPLTERELEVLALLERRYTDKEIAETLVISLKTAQTHILHISEKLNVHGRHAIVQVALDHGLI